MATPAGIRKYVDGFVVRHYVDLPDNWKGHDDDFLSEAAITLDLPVDQLIDEVVFDLPECSLSRSYQHFLDTGNRRDSTSIGVELTNYDDFATAHGPGAIAAALRSLQTVGYPCHYMRMITKRNIPGGY